MLTGLTNNTIYNIGLYAVNSIGNSVMSNFIPATPKYAAPSAPVI